MPPVAASKIPYSRTVTSPVKENVASHTAVEGDKNEQVASFLAAPYRVFSDASAVLFSLSAVEPAPIAKYVNALLVIPHVFFARYSKPTFVIILSSPGSDF